MTFQAKRLRIDINWDGAEVSAVAAEEPIFKAQCLDDATSVGGGCIDFFTTALLLEGTCSFDIAQIPAMRAQLEERLAQLDEAERGNLPPGR